MTDEIDCSRGDVIADCIRPFRARALERCFVGGQVFQEIRRQFMSDQLCF